MTERWAYWPHDRSYEVSTLGRVRSWKQPRRKPHGLVEPKMLRGYLDPSNGYICISSSGRGSNKYIHRMVLEAFVGDAKDGQEARHLDGDKLNNRLSNLSWGTRLENTEDRRRHGTMREGESCPQAKLTETDVREIKRRELSGERRCDLADEFGVTRQTINDIVWGRTWKHIQHGGTDG